MVLTKNIGEHIWMFNRFWNMSSATWAHVLEELWPHMSGKWSTCFRKCTKYVGPTSETQLDIPNATAVMSKKHIFLCATHYHQYYITCYMHKHTCNLHIKTSDLTCRHWDSSTQHLFPKCVTYLCCSYVMVGLTPQHVSITCLLQMCVCRYVNMGLPQQLKIVYLKYPLSQPKWTQV